MENDFDKIMEEQSRMAYLKHNGKPKKIPLIHKDRQLFDSADYEKTKSTLKKTDENA